MILSKVYLLICLFKVSGFIGYCKNSMKYHLIKINMQLGLHSRQFSSTYFPFIKKLACQNRFCWDIVLGDCILLFSLTDNYLKLRNLRKKIKKPMRQDMLHHNLKPRFISLDFTKILKESTIESFHYTMVQYQRLIIQK